MTATPAAPPPPLADLSDRLDRRGGGHLYRQIADLVRERIHSGELPPGTLLPSQRELSECWGIGEVTVRRALQELGEEGLLEAKPGAGTAVRRPDDRAGPVGPRALTIGVAFADLVDGYPFFTPVLAGLRSGNAPVAARLFDTPAPQQDAPHAAHAPPLAELDGLIMMSPVNLGLLALCQRRRLPTVLLFNDVADGFSRCIVPDYGQGVAQAVRHLAQRRRRRVALVTAGRERFSTGRWTDAFRTALASHDLPLAPERIVHAGYAERDGADAMRRLLALKPRPDAVLFASDHMARGGLLAAHEAGLRVPSQLSVIGAGPSLHPSDWTAPITTIDLGLNRMGRLALDTIEAIRGGAADAPFRQTVPATLQPGGTA